MLEFIGSSFNIYICSSEESIATKLNSSLQPFGYHTKTFSDGTKAMAAIRKEPVDLVIATPRLDGLNGIMLLRAIKQDNILNKIPVVMVTTDTNQENSGFYAGADDILGPGFTPYIVRMKVKSILRIRGVLHRKENELKLLELKVRQRTRQLEELTLAIVAALERASELNDRVTGNHILRVGRYSEIIAEALGFSPELLSKIRLYAPLHDVGKVAIPDSILQKTAPLSPEESDIMQKHTLYGYELLSMAKVDDVAKNIALSHHERMDGSGYPFGLKGTAIPLEARVVALADVFDAITTKRPYKKAMSFEDTIQFIEVESRQLFDPDVINAMIKRHKEIQEVFQSLNSPEAFIST